MRTIEGVRILNEEQIKKLSNHGLSRYRHKLGRVKSTIHGRQLCGEPCGCTIRRLDARDVESVKTLDWVSNRCREEAEARTFRQS